ncbi:MAG TPA: M20 family metallopeptidase [Candidatus Peribacteria bacterium]|nr:M20 family metallopeptidase [Candidatus Peribacteria bacterium]
MPESLSIPPLESIDEVQMARLTAQESFSIEGQRLKMELVESLIRDRYDIARSAVRQRLAPQYHDARALETEVNRQVQQITFRHMDLGDGRFNLIVEKGDDEFAPGTHENEDGPERIRPAYSVMVPAHVDTVQGNNVALERSGDRWQGLGVYDMGVGVLNGIALSVDTRVPAGMKVYWVFTVDEEAHSRGARLLIEKWDRFGEIDCIVSSEIGPLPPLRAGDRHMPVITARTGRQKFVANVNVRPNVQGHMALGNIPNATDAMAELLWLMRDRFYRGYRDPAAPSAPPEPALQKLHDLLGREEFESGVITSAKRPGYVPPHTASLDFAIKTVPPSTLAEMEATIKRIAKGIAKRGNWRDHGIDWSLELNPKEASYAPYEMPSDHPIVQVTRDIVLRVTGVAPQIMGAPSVADECDYAQAMLKCRHIDTFAGTNAGVITFPPNGDLAHNDGEYVSRADAARVRYVTKLLLEDPQGLQKLMRKPQDRK